MENTDHDTPIYIDTDNPTTIFFFVIVTIFTWITVRQDNGLWWGYGD
jgi:hypothetical protein